MSDRVENLEELANKLLEQQRKRREYNRQYRENHKSYFAQKSREYRERKKAKIQDISGNTLA